LGRSHLLPLMKPFLDTYPELDIDVQISDRYIDMVEDGVDLAIRIGTLRDSTLRARRIATSERVCVASREYLERHPAPRVPEDLSEHDCIVYTLMSSGHTWLFRDGEVAVHGRFRSNTLDGVYQAVLDGLGIAYVPLWMFEESLRDQRIELLLLDFSPPPVPINIVYSANRLLPTRASVFMDFIAKEFGANASLNVGALAKLIDDRHPSHEPSVPF
jgi:LysR family transcriptional regulator for bpeEF and oprC